MGLVSRPTKSRGGLIIQSYVAQLILMIDGNIGNFGSQPWYRKVAMILLLPFVLPPFHSSSSSLRALAFTQSVPTTSSSAVFGGACAIPVDTFLWLMSASALRHTVVR